MADDPHSGALRASPTTRPDGTLSAEPRSTERFDERYEAPDTPTTTFVSPTTTYVSTDTGRWRRDRVRWSAVWAGLLVTLSVYIVLQLTLVAVGVIEIGNAQSSDAWWSAAAALVAFFIGGVTTGASAMWNSVPDGVLHGVVMWALAAVSILVLSVAASGLALGALDSGGLFDGVTDNLEEAVDDAGDDVRGEDAEEAASWVLLGLGAAVAAAVFGGSVGAKMWDGRDDDDDDGDRIRR
jgi:hypothetical protein